MDFLKGFTNFGCNPNQGRLIDCSKVENNGCGKEAGVICGKKKINVHQHV